MWHRSHAGTRLTSVFSGTALLFSDSPAGSVSGRISLITLIHGFLGPAHLPPASLCLLAPEVRSRYLHLDLIVQKNLYILVRGNEAGGMAVIY